MRNISTKIFPFSLLFLATLSTQGADAAQSYSVNAGQSNVQINEHGVCKKVSNTGTKGVFVPTNTAAEWNGFLSHLPSGVAVSNCSNYGRIRTAAMYGLGSVCVLLNNGNVECSDVKLGNRAKYSGGNAISVATANDGEFCGNVGGVYGGCYGCALLNNGNVNCWNNFNSNAVSGYSGGNANSIGLHDFAKCVTTTAGNVDCWGVNAYGDASDESAGNAMAISVGGYDAFDALDASCILRSNGNIDCRGALNTDYNGGHAVSVSYEGYHACAVLDNGNVDCWGWNASGESNDYNGGNAVAVTTANRISCALLNNGNVDCWGANYYGETTDYNGGNAVAVTAGDLASCIVFSNGNMDCRGNGEWLHDNGWMPYSNDRNGGNIKIP